jgi:pilus assembly protein CpaC
MKKVFLITLLIITVLFCFRSYAVAQAEMAAVGEELKLYLDESKTISVNNPTRVAIGNPNVVDVKGASKKDMILSPRAVGKTTLVIWDADGERAYQVKVFAEDVIDIKRRIDNLLEKLDLPEVYTQAEEEEGKIFILGTVKNPSDRERISVVLGDLADKTVDLVEIKEEEAVVEIEVQVLELDRDGTTALGFSWPGAVNLTEPSRFTKLASIPDSFFRISEWTHTALSAQIDFLTQEGKARILSRPKIACQSGKESKLLIGGEVPVFTATQTPTGTTGEVEYKEYGIILNMKPVVKTPSRISINLGVEVSELGIVETTEYARAYPLTKRDAYTELVMDDGQTLVIGGLIKKKTREDLRKTPWLGDVPILGSFFRKKTVTTGGGTGAAGDVELFITLSPRIVKEKEPVAQQQETVVAKAEIPAKRIEPAPLEPASIPDELKGYIGLVKQKIVKNTYYPPQAKDAGWKGVLKLNILLSADGNIKDISISKTTGFKVLDDAGREAVRRAAPFPALPAQLKLRKLRIEIPIVYHTD